MVLILLFVLNLGVVMPIAPTFIEDHFAKQMNHGVEIHCTDFKDKDTEPQCCKDASSKASFYQTLCDSIAALFTFFVAPVVGQYSDAFGRMPYVRYLLSPTKSLSAHKTFSFPQILPASCVVGLPSITLLLCDLGIFGLEPYYLVTMLSPLYLSLSLLMSYVADVLEPRDRATGFALILGGFGLGISIAPAIAIFLSTRNTLILGSAMAVLSPIWAIFFMKESLSPENRIRSDKLSCMNPFSPMKILCKNRLYRILTPALMLVGVCTTGTDKLDTFYITDVFDFSSTQLSLALIFVGFGTLFFQIVMFKPVASAFGLRNILIFSSILIVCSKVGYLLVGLYEPNWSWWIYFQYAIVSPLTLWVFPAVSAIKSNTVSPKLQGQVQGALFGVRCLAQGTAPIGLALLYADVSGGTKFPDHPSLPYLLIAILACISSILILLSPVNWRSYYVGDEEDENQNSLHQDLLHHSAVQNDDSDEEVA